MASIDRRQPGGNSGPIAVRPDVARPHAGERAPWVVRTPITFADARTNPRSPRKRLMLLLLDGWCRTRCYCWVGNQEAADAFGCGVRNLQLLYREMQADGDIHCVEADSAKTGRVGIVLRRRADPSLPVADDTGKLALAIASLKEQREGAPPTPPRAQEAAPIRAQEIAPRRAQEIAPEVRSSSKEDGPEKDRGAGSGRVPRRRRGEPGTDATPSARSGGGLAAGAAGEVPGPIPAPADPGPTAGQREFLAALSPGQRARFDGWGAGKRAQALGAHARGFDPAALRMVLADLGTAPPAPLPGPEAGPAELIAALAGPMGASLMARCSSALMVVLGDRGGSKSYGAMLKLCGEVIKGTRRPESLCEPLARTLAKLDGGEAIGNPAAYWTRGVANFDREHRGTDER